MFSFYVNVESSVRTIGFVAVVEGTYKFFGDLGVFASVNFLHHYLSLSIIIIVHINKTSFNYLKE